MPGLPLFTDNHVRGPLIKALRQRGRDVARAVDLFGQENDDAELFAYAAKEGRVFLTCVPPRRRADGIALLHRDSVSLGRQGGERVRFHTLLDLTASLR